MLEAQLRAAGKRRKVLFERMLTSLLGGNPKSKYCFYIAQTSMLCPNHVKKKMQISSQFATSQVAQTVAYTLTLLAQNAREVTQFPQVILPANMNFY